ncbi:metallophosphoesterase [Arthrobacter sp. GCM10027362]|uniref:metallophosphoesterase family protein n=1 Tax=Arthrobacter sp. GCM10027362 TaxID=3273379 RepID=UPI00363E97C5
MTGKPFVMAGDWHGDTVWATHIIRQAAKAGAERIFHVGDLAVLWPGRDKYKFDRRIEQRLVENGIDLVFVDGNHDNHTELRALPVQEDGLARVRPHILYLPRGARTDYEGLTVGGLGGAFSVDYEWRRPGRDWWPGIEQVQPDDVAKLVAHGRVNILLTHDVPAAVPMTMGLKLSAEIEAQARVSRLLLQEAVDALKPAHVFSGHWHQRKTSTIAHQDGSATRVDVLDMNISWGNAVLVWTGQPALKIEPLVPEPEES